MAGLAAAVELSQSGYQVTIVEARDRIGGRVYTLHDPVLNAPIELGAEFIHGKPREILDHLRNAPIHEVEGDNWCIRDGEIRECDFFSQVDDILSQMSDRAPDESFAAFLHRCFPDANDAPDLKRAKQRALAYVSGFNAADPELVGVHWLTESARAEEKIEGDRAFRARSGYTSLLNDFGKQLQVRKVPVRFDTVVEEIRWRSGGVEILARNDEHSITLSAPKVLVTIPLSLLQSPPDHRGSIRFAPQLPASKYNAFGKLQMGHVIRATLCFKYRFWEDIKPTADQRKTLSNMSFLFSEEELFPTWWTTMPQELPIITGWAPFRSADKLSGQDRDFVVERALTSLGNSLKIGRAELEQLLRVAYVHDWQTDPFSHGAYSYGKVGSSGAQQALGASVDSTLFFAGEATDVTGHNGTVHGAIASGLRAAREITDSQ